MDCRAYWIRMLTRVAGSVWSAAARRRLRAEMPVESAPGADRRDFAHLEAAGRTLAGLGPWLEVPLPAGPENDARAALRAQVLAGLESLADPGSPDRINVERGAQPLVDAAFLAQGLLRCWDSVWLPLPAGTRQALTGALRATRAIRPGFCNWLLFSAMVEAFLCRADGDWDAMRVDYALRQHAQWYAGDGMYGDGPRFHWDYYNSFVIQPMLFDLAHAGGEVARLCEPMRDAIDRRLRRHAAVLERMIAPDGSWPPVGRSIAYRCGAFHALALAALRDLLPGALPPGAVRGALTAAIRRSLEPDGTFDGNGWLRIGLAGAQPGLGESYISTGSLYLCATAFLPLGLGPDHPFWTAPDADWTSRRIWGGANADADHALDD